MVRVEKTRIGGGFGAKQTAVIEIYPAFVTWKTKKPCKLVYTRKETQTASSPRHEMELRVRGAKQTAVIEIYPAFVTWKTKKPCKLVYTRKETQTASSPRHEMELRVRLGAMKDGHIRAIDMYTLSNTGAYGEHGPTTVGLTGHKAIPMYGKTEAYRFACDVVYTNEMSAGAYRGYGATQGLFAVETTVNELAEIIHMDPIALREKNIVREGDVMPAYFGEVNTSCALDRCIARVREMIGWDEKYPCRDMGNGKVRGVGIGLALQGSGISGVDVGSAALKVDDEGYYTLRIGAADMGASGWHCRAPVFQE